MTPAALPLLLAIAAAPRITADGDVHAWLVPHAGPDARAARLDAADGRGFRLRRARLALRGNPSAPATFAVRLELGDDPTAGSPLLDAWGQWTVDPRLRLRLGVQRVPFDVATSVPATHLQLPERALSTLTLGERRELGLVADVRLLDGRVRYQAGLFQGTDGRFTVDGDDTRPLLAVRVTAAHGRVGPSEADLAGGALRLSVGLGGSVGGLFGRHPWGLAADVRMKAGGLSVTAAHLRDGDGAGQSRTGSYLQVGWLLVPPRLEVAVRAETVDDATVVSDTGDARAYAVALTWYIEEAAGAGGPVVQAAFHHREELDRDRVGVVALDNDSALLSLRLPFGVGGGWLVDDRSGPPVTSHSSRVVRP